MEKRIRSILCAVALAAGVVGWAAAGEHDNRSEDAETASRGVKSGEFVPLATIMAAIRERYEGEVIETEFESEDNGRPYYEFHILRPDGHVVEVKVDAGSGRYLKIRPDDD